MLEGLERQEVRDLLQQGHELDGIVQDARGVVLARGKVRIEGAQLVGLDFGSAVVLRLSHRGRKFDAPLHQPITVRKGVPFDIQFAKAVE